MRTTGRRAMRRVLVANRGEIALRAIRACRQLGHESLAVFSSADANSPHRWAADHAICIGPPPATASYLNAAALLETAIAMKVMRSIPVTGFWLNKHVFAERCCEAGLNFIGPDGNLSPDGRQGSARRPLRPSEFSRAWVQTGLCFACACRGCCGRSRVSTTAEGEWEGVAAACAL